MMKRLVDDLKHVLHRLGHVKKRNCYALLAHIWSIHLDKLNHFRYTPHEQRATGCCVLHQRKANVDVHPNPEE
eukprot:5928309-Amphidinium_carterae.1